MGKLLLIDGNALLHRAYHALPPLTSPDGTVINAVYGFFSMLLKVLDEQKPTHLAVCFDRAAPTFRQALFAGYHENRPRMADDLVIQVGLVHEILEKMSASIFEIDGYEADDLIGTLAKQATEINTNLKFEIIILTGDRDMLQLINQQVKVLMPITGISKMILFDEKGVVEKYGVKPSQFVDYKALIGDASDNYPGVAGIGPKTAASLLQDFESFENLYKHLALVPERIAVRLATDAEQAALAKKLATILQDAPVHLKITACSLTHFNSLATKQALEKLGIKSLQNRIPVYIEKLKQSQIGLLD